MSVFRRRRRAEDEPVEAAAVPEAVADADEAEDDEEPRQGLSPRPDGPWDVAEQPDAEGYIDLGSLRLRGREAMELRLDVDEATNTVTAVTVQLGGSLVQLQVFAAPRSEGIWSEIRAEIASSVTRQGGTVTEQTGVFGPELRAKIPARTADGRTGYQPARFSGVDGPRWFLRAVFHGPAVADHEAAAPLEAVIRDLVVVRGDEAMAPRELLPLRLPALVGADGQLLVPDADAAPDDAAEQERFSGDLDPFRRGPEITEIH